MTDATLVRLPLADLRTKYRAALDVLFKSLVPEQRQVAIKDLEHMRAEFTRRGEAWAA